MKILVINCGSSSIKCQLYDADTDRVLTRGIVAGIGEGGSYLKYQAGDVNLQKEVSIFSHGNGFELIVNSLLDEILNRESGLSGVSGISNDMREVIESAGKGDERCQLTMEIFTYQVIKYIGSYSAAMAGIDTLVFTAGIGENSPLIRAMICSGLEFLGIKLDEDANNKAVGIEQIISLPDSEIKGLVVPTDEERMIALDTVELTFPSRK